jgi:hypothetical protein
MTPLCGGEVTTRSLLHDPAQCTNLELELKHPVTNFAEGKNSASFTRLNVADTIGFRYEDNSL